MSNKKEKKTPLVYDEKYNISFFGLEDYLHSFDSKKYRKVYKNLKNHFGLDIFQIYKPDPLDDQLLLKVHTKEYLNSLKWSTEVAKISEIPLLGIIPNFIVQNCLLLPMKLATSGTILAAKLSIQYGWSINLSGGYHHAKASSGSGFCFFADIPLAIREIFEDPKLNKKIEKILIVDLDAHQGNGFETIHTQLDVVETENSDGVMGILFGNSRKRTIEKTQIDRRVAIFDIYNCNVFPGDSFAKSFINFEFAVSSQTNNEEYLEIVDKNLPIILESFEPDLVFYNAGTDIYEEDPLGRLNVTENGIILRDEIVFRECKKKRIPIVMTLSGGYTMKSADIISKSIINLVEKSIIKF